MADLIQIQYEVVDKNKSLKTALTGVERMEKSLAKLSKEIVAGTVTQDRQTKALIAYGRELKRLTGMTGNQAYGAVVKYKNAMVNQTVAQNKAAESAQRLARVQDYLAVRQGRATLAVQNQNAALNQTKNKMNGSNVAIQQLGYQFGDFAVQVQGGTSAFVAFSQQATQLVGILPLVAGPLGLTVGAAVGLSAALGVLIPIGSAVGRMFMEMGGSAESASKDLDALKKAIEDLESATDDVAEAMTFSLEGVFVGATEELQNLLRTYKEMKAEIAKEALAKSLMPLVNNIANLMDELTERKSSRQTLIDVGGDNLPKATKNKILQEMTAIAEMQVEAGEFLTGIQTALQGPSEKFAENMLKVSRAINNSDTATQSMRDQLLQVLAKSGLLAQQKEDAANKQEAAQKKQEHGLEMIARANAENARLLAQDAAERDAKEKEFQDRLNRTRAIMGQLVAERRAAAKAESEEDRAAAIEAAAKLEIELFNANAAYVKKQKELDAAGDLAILNNQANRELELSRANDAYEKLSDAERQKRLDELNDKIQEMAERLAIPFAAVLDLIRQAKEEAEIGLDAFGGAGSFKYGGSQKFDGLAEYEKRLRKVTKATEDADKAAEALRKELEAPMVKAIDSVSNAFGDFIADGLRDFKSFASSIVSSFKSMIAQMIATAARNKIMLSMGMGGTAFANAATAGNVAGIGGNAAFGPIGSFMGSFAGGGAAGSGVLGGLGSVFGAGGMGLGGSFGSLGTLLSGGSSVAAGGTGFAATLGAAIPAIAAVAVVVGLFTKKTKLLDSGLRTTVEGFDVAIETFKKTQSSRLFGLLKGSKVTAYEAASAEVADPLIEAIGNMQQSIVDAAGTLGIGANAFDDFSYQFKLSLKGLTEEEQLQKINEEITKMGDSFASLTGHFETMNELLAVAQQRYDLTTRLLQLQGNGEELLRRSREREMDATHELNRELLQTVYALEDLQAASARANQAVAIANQGVADANQAVADATASLRQAIDAEKGRIQASFASLISGLTDRLDVANEAMDKSRSTYDLLSNALSGRSAIGDDALAGRRSSSLDFLRRGNFSDEDKLKRALDTVAEPSEQLFGSFVDYARDFGRTSAIIDDAKSIARVQLDFDERQVLLLQDQIENAKASEQAQLDALDKQFEALTNVNSSVLSVKDAIGSLASAMQAQAAAQAKAAAASAAAAAGAAAAAAANAAANAGSNAGSNAGANAGSSSFAEQFGTGTKYGNYDLASIGSSSELLQAAASLGVQTSGQTGAQIQQAVSNASGMAVKMGTSIRAQQFAMGGYHTGGMRMVGERGPELEATGPSRIFSHNQTASMFRDPDLKEAVNELRREVSGLRGEQRQMQATNAKYVKRNYDINRKWDVDGLPATRT